jgi:hypothetical protein
LENYEPDDVVIFENQPANNQMGEMLPSFSPTTIPLTDEDDPDLVKDPSADDDDQIPDLVIDDEFDEQTGKIETIEINEDNNPFYMIDETPIPTPIPPPVVAPTMNPKFNREMKRLAGFFNPQSLAMTTPTTSGKVPVQEELTQQTQPMSPLTHDDIHEQDDKLGEQVNKVEPPTDYLCPSEERALYTVAIIPKHRALNTHQSKTTMNESNMDFSKTPSTQLRDILTVPTTFNEAVNHPNEWVRTK